MGKVANYLCRGAAGLVVQGAIVHRSGPVPVASGFKLDLCNIEACASFGVAHYRAGELPQGFLAGTGSSTHGPYRRLYALALGSKFRAWVRNLLGRLGSRLLQACVSRRAESNTIVENSPKRLKYFDTGADNRIVV